MANIYLVDESENDSIIPFLTNEVEGEKSPNPSLGNLWSYLENSQSRVSDSRLRLQILGNSPYSTKSHKLRSPEVIDGLSTSVAAACIYGASRCLVELLKAWVEERKSRKLRITDGNKEINIEGGVSRKELEEAIRLLESEFGKSKDID